jgi:hypothetical protein
MKLTTRIFSRFPVLWALLFFTAMTVIMTWPLVLKMGNAMVGQVGDNIYFVWMIGWVKKALFELHTNPFKVWFLNFPEGWNMAYTEITPAQLLLALPFSLVWGPIFAYNAAQMITFILSGITMFLWVRHLSGNNGAALVAGMAFAFLPYHFAHFLIGHLNLTGTQWLPLYFWGLWDVLQTSREGKMNWKPAFLGGAGLGLIALTSQYYLFMVLIVSSFMAAVYLLFMEREQLRNARFWKHAGVMGLTALPLVIIALAPFFALLGQGGLPDRNIGVTRLYSASPTDFLLPSTDHFLWGAWIGRHFNREMWVEGTLYLGAVSSFLGFITLFKRKEIPQRRLVELFFWGGLLAVILAMGIDFHWMGKAVEIKTPVILMGWVKRETIPILLPGYFLFKYFPFYAKLRALMRFGVFELTFTSACAGLGMAWILERVKLRWRTILVVLVIGLIFLDFYPGPYQEFARVEPRPVDLWLAEQPGNGAIVQFPFSKAEDQEQTYYTLFHGKPFVGGFFNAFPPPQYSRIGPLLVDFPDQESVGLVRGMGVEFILVDVDEYLDTDLLRKQCEALGLKYITRLGDQMVFKF